MTSTVNTDQKEYTESKESFLCHCISDLKKALQYAAMLLLNIKAVKFTI